LGGPLGPKLSGVIAFIPGADLTDIAGHSSYPRVRETLTASVAGDLHKLRERSPSALVERYPGGVPFVIAYNAEDTILPVAATATFAKQLVARGLPVACYSIPGDHSFVTQHLDERIDYRRVLADLGKTSDLAGPVPTRAPTGQSLP
jgi:dienelactone hydrolase